MRYDPRFASVLKPTSLAPLLRPGAPWTLDALCAECSRLAYFPFERDPAVAQSLCAALGHAGLGEVAFFADAAGGTEAFAAHDGAGARSIVAFRGTEPDLTDIRTDLRAALGAWSGTGRVHEGFRDALGGVWDEVHAWVRERPQARTWFTGHSLGGALATLAAARVPDARLVTFGSPRVGDARFAALFEARSVARYVLCCDLVPRLPPAALGYAHTPGLRYIDRAGAVHAEAGAAFIEDDGAAARGEFLRREAWRPGNVALRDFADHAPVNYVAGLLGADPSA